MPKKVPRKFGDELSPHPSPIIARLAGAGYVPEVTLLWADELQVKGKKKTGELGSPALVKAGVGYCEVSRTERSIFSYVERNASKSRCGAT